MRSSRTQILIQLICDCRRPLHRPQPSKDTILACICTCADLIDAPSEWTVVVLLNAAGLGTKPPPVRRLCAAKARIVTLSDEETLLRSLAQHVAK